MFFQLYTYMCVCVYKYIYSQTLQPEKGANMVFLKVETTSCTSESS